MKTTLAAGATAAFAPAEFGHAAESKLSWKHFPAGPNGFFRAPVLVSGPTEALLIDGGFSFSDGRALVDAVKATAKKLTAIYISQSDPDYYFSLKPLREAFPNVKVIAASATLEAIKVSRRSSPCGDRSSRRTVRRRSPMSFCPRHLTFPP